MTDPYELKKQQIQQRSQANNQQSQDALTRRFAAQGGLNSGAHIKQAQIANQVAAQQAEEQMTNIDISSAQEKNQQNFQSSETQKARDFAKREADLGRQFQEKAFAADQIARNRQIDLAEKAFEEDKAATEFNKMISALGAGGTYPIDEYLRAKRIVDPRPRK